MFYKSHFGTILITVLSMFMGVVMACFRTICHSTGSTCLN